MQYLRQERRTTRNLIFNLPLEDAKWTWLVNVRKCDAKEMTFAFLLRLCKIPHEYHVLNCILLQCKKKPVHIDTNHVCFQSKALQYEF